MDAFFNGYVFDGTSVGEREANDYLARYAVGKGIGWEVDIGLDELVEGFFAGSELGGLVAYTFVVGKGVGKRARKRCSFADGVFVIEGEVIIILFETRFGFLVPDAHGLAFVVFFFEGSVAFELYEFFGNPAVV